MKIDVCLAVKPTILRPRYVFNGPRNNHAPEFMKGELAIIWLLPIATMKPTATFLAPIISHLETWNVAIYSAARITPVTCDPAAGTI